MRKLLLWVAALGFMAAVSSPLFAQGDDDGGGGYTPPPPPPPPGTPPPPPPPPPPVPPPPPPPPGGGPGWGGGGGGGGWPGYPPPPPPPPVPPVPSVPPLPPPPPPPAAPPAVPPGGGGPGVPSVPSIPSIPPPASQPTTPPPPAPGIGAPPGTPTTSGPSMPPGGSNPGVPTAGGTTGSSISSPDALKKDAVDRPVGVVQVKLPGTPGSGPGTGPGGTTPPGNGNLPPGEVPPGTPPVEDPPTFFGEPVSGKFAFVLDASGSMAGGRIASLRAEATATIMGLTDTDEFDCMSYGTQFADSTMELWGGLMPATDGNKNSATSFINGPALNPGAGTPTHRALEKACSMYPEDLSKLILLTDGAPNATGNASQILAHFPGWWSKFPQETVLVAICIGGVGEAVNFMRDLASLDDSTGVFINKP